MLVVICAGAVINSINPYIYGLIIDNITQGQIEALKKCLLVFFVNLILIQILAIGESYIGQIAVTIIENDVKHKLLKRIVLFRCCALDKFMEGELLNRLEFDAEAIVDYYIDIITNSIMIICNFAISLYFIIHISKQLTVLSVLMIPLLYLINFMSRHKLRLLQQLRKKFDDKYFSFVSELLSNIKGVKIFQLEQSYIKKYKTYLDEKFRIEKKNLVFTNIINFIRGFTSNIFDILILYTSAMIIFSGKMTIGNLVAFNTYLAKLFEALNKVLELNMNRQSILINSERLDELQRTEIDKESIDTKLDKCLSADQIEFRNVYFKYDNTYVLKGVNLKINSPGLYSIVGENGSGKSTIFKLLDAFYKCAEGEISVCSNGSKIREIYCWRNNIAYLSKEPFLVNDTVYNNIKLDMQDVTMEKVREVCKSVGLHGDILEFGQQYNTMIGECGSRLSSGQKQKLAFARLLLRSKPIILLDEATSDLDSNVRKRIYLIIKELSEKSIVLNVSHDIWETSKSDRIIVLNNGKVVGDGCHEVLLRECEHYRNLMAE